MLMEINWVTILLGGFAALAMFLLGYAYSGAVKKRSAFEKAVTKFHQLCDKDGIIVDLSCYGYLGENPYTLNAELFGLIAKSGMPARQFFNTFLDRCFWTHPIFGNRESYQRKSPLGDDACAEAFIFELIRQNFNSARNSFICMRTDFLPGRDIRSYKQMLNDCEFIKSWANESGSSDLWLGNDTLTLENIERLEKRIHERIATMIPNKAEPDALILNMAIS
jgi:hypothetical protein